MGELDRKEEAAKDMKDAIVLMRGLGYTDEKIIDICATIMAETVPAAQIDMHLGVVRTESPEEFEAEMRKYQAE